MSKSKAVNDPGQVPLGFEEFFTMRGEAAAETKGIPQPEANQQMQEEQLGTAGMAAFCWLYKIARSACHESKIEAEYLPLVHALEKSQQVNLTELAEKVGVHPTTVRRQMNALEKNGLGTVRPGRLRKKKAMIPEIFAPGLEELSRCRAKIGSELKVRLDCPTGQGEEFVKALERLLAISKRAPR